MTQDLLDTLYEVGRGSIDATVKLYMEVQRFAILQGQSGLPELITPELLRQAATGDAFGMVLQRLAMESGKTENIKKPRAVVEKAMPQAVPRQEEPVINLSSVKAMPKVSKTVDKKGRELLTALKENGQLVCPDDAF
ncbi:hypothetical protein SDC9_190367 [bioreactor metagenome]|uniref:Uncharacterized protein n=1 Tax=bioreactor metagenome TaxID=1076179 RepID=A0A645HX90_9ZZZZ